MAKKSDTGIRPLHDKILVKRDDAETKTSSGIFLPSPARSAPRPAPSRPSAMARSRPTPASASRSPSRRATA